MTIKINDGLAYNSGDDLSRSIIDGNYDDILHHIVLYAVKETIEWMRKNVSAGYMRMLYEELEKFHDNPASYNHASSKKDGIEEFLEYIKPYSTKNK